MPSSAIARTVSARRRELTLLLLAAGLFLVVALGFHQPSQRVLTVGSHHFKIETAATGEKRSEGLSGRASLGRNDGMLFVYDREEEQCIWMKEMRFSIDAVWADNERKVVHLVSYISPDTYPENFCSSEPAAYVIELPAGSIDRAGIREGQVLNF